MSRNLTFSAAVRRLIPIVKHRSSRNPRTKLPNCSTSNTREYSAGGTINKKEINRLIAFANIIDIGITACGNLDFFISERSFTIDADALDRESEKKFQVSNPVKR